MVRTLDGPLTSALAALTKAPAISVQVQDQMPHFQSYQSPAGTDQLHDACVANDGSIVRATITRGGTSFDRAIQVQRITDPSISAQWTTWTTLTGGTNNMFQDGGVCCVNDAIANVIRVFGQQGTGGNAIFVWTSSNNGATWTGPVTVLSPPLSALTKGIGSAGNNDVFFIYDVAGGEQIGVSFFSAGWGALVTSTQPIFAAGAGICVAWNGSSYMIIYSDGFSLLRQSYTLAGGNWATQTPVAMATSTSINRYYPRMSFFDSVYSVICTERDTGALTGLAWNYPRIRQSSDLAHWSNGWIMHQLTELLGTVYLKLNAPQSGSSGARYYMITMAAVHSCQVYSNANTRQFLDASASVLMYKREERGEKPARFECVLDNAGGVLNTQYYSGGTTFAPISKNASIVLSEGYKVGGPPPVTPDIVKTGTYRIQQYILERTPEQNRLRIIAYDHSRDLDLQCRWQMTYTNQTVLFLIAEICARAGCLNYNVPSTTNTGYQIPTYIMHAGQTYRAQLNDLCNTYGLWYFMDQNEMLQFLELSASDPIVWTYQPEWETAAFGTDDTRANHVIVSGKPPTGGSVFAITEGEAYDDSDQQIVRDERLLHHVDQKLTTTAQCQAKAAAMMLQEQRAAIGNLITVPTNPALQLYDGVALSDYAAPTGSGASNNTRIITSMVQFDAQTATFEQHLALEGL